MPVENPFLRDVAVENPFLKGVEEPSLVEKGVNVLRGVAGIPKRAYEEIALPFAENITSQTLGLIDAGTTGAVVARNYLQDLIATGSPEKAYELAKGRDPGVPQLSKMFTPSTPLGKASSEISGKIWAAPAEIAGEMTDLPLESVNAPEYVRGPVKAVAELASYPVAIGGAAGVKGLVRQYLPEAVKKVSNERMLKDRAKLEVKENIETSAEARTARTEAQQYNREKTSAEMENFAEEKLGQLREPVENPFLIDVEPVAEAKITPKETFTPRSQALDLIPQLSDKLPTWDLERLRGLAEKDSTQWTGEDRLFLKEQQGKVGIDETPVRPVESVPAQIENPFLVDQFGKPLIQERSQFDQGAEKGGLTDGKVQAKTEATVEERYKAEAEDAGVTFNGVQETGIPGRAGIPLFTDPQTKSTFSVKAGESVKDVVEKKREEFASASSASITEKAKTVFGETNDLKKTGFITPDGVNLDFSTGVETSPRYTHSKIGDVYGETPSAASTGKAIQDGMARIQVDSKGNQMYLEVSGPLTKEQVKSLTDNWESSGFNKLTVDLQSSDLEYRNIADAAKATKDNIGELLEKVNESINSPVTEQYPGQSILRSGVNPLELPSVVTKLGRTVKDLWEEAKNTDLAENLKTTKQAFNEFIKEPERVMNKEEAGKKIFKELATAEENVNAFIYRNFKEYEKATKGIKKGSKESEQIGKALDGQISPDQLTQNERRAYDFLKDNFEAMITEYARKAAGSEEAYQKVLRMVGSKIEKRTRVKDLDPELRAQYDDLYKQAMELRGDRKVSDLRGEEKLKYEDLKQEMRDVLSNDFRKRLTEGEADAYDILSRKIKDYLPHMFEKEDLLKMFQDDLVRSKAILAKTTNKGLTTRMKNRINELEKAIDKMNGGGLVTFSQLPSEIFFRFFSPRKGKQGYSFDALQAYETYLFGMGRKMFDEPALKKISQEHFKQLSPELKPYAQALVDHYFGYDKGKGDWLAGAITSFEWMRTLGLNPRSAVVNLTQRLNTLVWVGEKYAAKAEKMMLLDREKANEIFEKSGIAREVPRVLAEGPMPKGMEAVRSVVGYMFNKVELGNRKHAYMSGYLKGLDVGKTRGLEGEALESFAKKEAMKVVHKTQFRYGKLGMPKVMWNPFGRVALQFGSYTVKQIGFLADLWRKDPKTFLKWFAYAEGVNYGLQELFDMDMSNALGVGVSFGEALKAVTALGEGDTSAAFRHLKQTVKPGSGLLPSGPGPLISGAVKVGQAAGEGKGMEQVRKELTPVMYTRGKQAVEAIKNEEDGEYPILDDKGHPMYRLSAKQLAQRTLGPKTAKEGKEQKKWSEERNLELERKEGLQDVVKAYLSGDDDKLDDALVENKEAVRLALKNGSLVRMIKDEQDRRMRTQSEREKPTSVKRVYQFLREGEQIQ